MSPSPSSVPREGPFSSQTRARLNIRISLSLWLVTKDTHLFLLISVNRKSFLMTVLFLFLFIIESMMNRAVACKFDVSLRSTS